MSTGPLTYLYKKYVLKIQQSSPDAAKTTERIREEHGPNAGYQAALALIHCIEAQEKSGKNIDPARYAIYLKDYPTAVPQLRRALSYLLEDQGQTDYQYRFRD